MLAIEGVRGRGLVQFLVGVMGVEKGIRVAQTNKMHVQYEKMENLVKTILNVCTVLGYVKLLNITF